MASLLERGEKLDDLVSKSDELSAQSKMFYKTAKKTNACCVRFLIFLYLDISLIEKFSIRRMTKEHDSYIWEHLNDFRKLK